MDSIIINNITEKDVLKHHLRITINNKLIFHPEVAGQPMSHDYTFFINGESFKATYTIGSHDGKSRSGVLRLRQYVYDEILRIEKGNHLQVTKQGGGGYKIQKL